MKTSLRRLFMTVVAASLIGPNWNFAFAREMIRVPPSSVGALRTNLFMAARDHAESRFGEILADYLAKEEESGLIVIGAAEEHEVESARKFSAALKARLGLRVVLLSTWGASSVPAFDGVVIDSKNKIVANFSMKRVSSHHVEKLGSAAKGAFSKIRRFSELDSWIEVMLNQIPRHPTNGNLSNLSEHQNYILSRSYNEISDEVAIFKIGSDRPNWVFIDNSSEYKFTEEDAVDFIKEISETLDGHADRSIILHSKGRFFPFKGSRTCESDLNPKH